MAGPTGAAGVKHGKSLMSEATGALNASMLKVCRVVISHDHLRDGKNEKEPVAVTFLAAIALASSAELAVME